MNPLLAHLLFDPRCRKIEFRAAFLIFFAIVVFGSIPGARQELDHVASGLILHGVAYSFIALLLFCGADGSPWVKAFKAVLIVAVMGMIDECVQSLFPYRHAALGDWAVDVTAASVTAALLLSTWPKQTVGRPPH